MGVAGKLALVTGSTSGIGEAVAHALAEQGCNIIITGIGEAEDITKIVDDIKRKHGVDVEYIGGDLLKKEEIETLTSCILERHPLGVDILVNNAGFNLVGPVDGYPDDRWDSMVGIHLSAPFHLTKRLLPAMKQKGWGRIINMSSQMGVVSIPGKAVYSAVKSGLIGLTKGVALEVAEFGITCNAVCPTYARTKLVDVQLEKISQENGTTFQEALDGFVATVPTKKLVDIEQIAELVVFLACSAASAQMTGAHYLIDGGFTAQ